MAVLLRKLSEQGIGQIERISSLPSDVTYDFDPANENDPAVRAARVQKSRVRRISTLEHSRFRVREVIRTRQAGRQRRTERSMPWILLAPKGQHYGYDLIAHVGMERTLHGHRLSDVGRALRERKPAINVPYSSLHEMEMKFLYYLGHMHQQATGILREYLEGRGRVQWLADGTLEPGTPVFFGVKEAEDGMLLGSWKMATENTEAISGCFAETAERFGMPATVYHDLSAAITEACETERFHVPHRVCHSHFARDVGDDLYARPQEMLRKRLRQLKLQSQLREQRKSVTSSLRQAQNAGHKLLLADVLAGRAVPVQWTKTRAWELLMGLHQWVLDYPCDGHRQGFPFDPYLLYLHRRIRQAAAGLDRVLRRDATAKRLPRVIHNMAAKLRGYLEDKVVKEAATLYEEAYEVFDRLRQALRLSANSSCPLSESYALEGHQTIDVQDALEELHTEFTEAAGRLGQCNEGRLYQIVLDHLDKYWQQLCPQTAPRNREGKQVRTTNELESDWRWAKRNRRRAHGRSKLTRDFCALPSEYMLVNNLRNERYVQLVLGDISALPAKLAEAGQTSGPFSKWRNQHQALSPGRLPKKLIRKENCLDDITGLLAIDDNTLN